MTFSGIPVAGLLFGIALAAITLAIAIIDFRRLIIPDCLNGALAATGLAYQVWAVGGVPVTAILFSAAVFSAFLLLRFGFARLRGRTGLGLGDVKLAGASALWFSPWNLPLFLLVACCSALLFVFASWLKNGNQTFSARIPFGPFLGFGLLVVWLLEHGPMETFIPAGIN